RIVSMGEFLGSSGWHNFSGRELAMACFLGEWNNDPNQSIKKIRYAIDSSFKHEAKRKSEETGLAISPVQILRDATGNYKGNLYGLQSIDAKLDASETDFRESRRVMYPRDILKTDSMAYFLGICYGAGMMVRSEDAEGHAVRFVIQGDRHDHDFYSSKVEALARKFFSRDLEVSLRSKSTRDNSGTYTLPTIYFNSKAITTFFKEYLGFPTGEKIGVEIPKVIKSAPKHIRAEFLKGIVATMGHIKTQSTRNSKRLCLMDRDEPFILELGREFKRTLGIKPVISHIPTTQQLNFTNGDTLLLRKQRFFTNPHHIARF
ncbi:MAG TPA: hypothetical protein VKE88_03185, partial [Candidatus Nanoarchaeia archaeon]|nr:hypothetical protein [Candidatus Nanoarchaeia archaeon]